MTPNRLTRPVVAPIVVMFGAALAGCSHIGSDDIAGETIRYQVEYSGSPYTRLTHRALSITYASSDGTQEERDVGLPWTKAVGTAGSGFTASVKAQFYGYGTLACRIVSGGTVIDERRSAEGPYPTVECSA